MISYLHSAHVESKAVVASVFRGSLREPKSSLGMHPGDGMKPGLPSAEVAEIPLVTLALHLSLPGLQSAQEVVKGGGNCEHLKIVCNFGICKHVCMHISLGADP